METQAVNSTPPVSPTEDIAEAMVTEIVSTWTDRQPWNDSQVPLLLVGGFQGSGKTMLLNHLEKQLGLCVIRTDQIRFDLMQKGYQGNELSEKTLQTEWRALEEGMKKGLPLAIDANAHQDRLDRVEIMVNFSYQTTKILLSARPETLRSRVQSRQPQEKTYNGTLGDLEASLQQRIISPQNYDLVLNSEEYPFKELLQFVVYQHLRKFYPESIPRHPKMDYLCRAALAQSVLGIQPADAERKTPSFLFDEVRVEVERILSKIKSLQGSKFIQPSDVQLILFFFALKIESLTQEFNDFDNFFGLEFVQKIFPRCIDSQALWIYPYNAIESEGSNPLLASRVSCEGQEFIACIGPNEERSMSQFIDVLVHSNPSLVVNLTRSDESIVPYWEPCMSHAYPWTVQSVQNNGDYNHARFVWDSRKEIDYVGMPFWQDCTAISAQKLLEIIQYLEPFQQGNRPILVHCRAGRGRTGVVMAAWHLYKTALQERNVHQTVTFLRLQRSGMIQTPEQYQLLYDFVKLLDQPVGISV